MWTQVKETLSELRKSYLVARIPRPTPLAVVVFPVAWLVAVRRCVSGAMMFGFLRNPTAGWMVLYGLSGLAAGVLWLPWAAWSFPGALVRYVRGVRKEYARLQAEKAGK